MSKNQIDSGLIDLNHLELTLSNSQQPCQDMTCMHSSVHTSTPKLGIQPTSTIFHNGPYPQGFVKQRRSLHFVEDTQLIAPSVELTSNPYIVDKQQSYNCPTSRTKLYICNSEQLAPITTSNSLSLRSRNHQLYDSEQQSFQEPFLSRLNSDDSTNASTTTYYSLALNPVLKLLTFIKNSFNKNNTVPELPALSHITVSSSRLLPEFRRFRNVTTSATQLQHYQYIVDQKLSSARSRLPFRIRCRTTDICDENSDTNIESDNDHFIHPVNNTQPIGSYRTQSSLHTYPVSKRTGDDLNVSTEQKITRRSYRIPSLRNNGLSTHLETTTGTTGTLLRRSVIPSNTKTLSKLRQYKDIVSPIHGHGTPWKKVVAFCEVHQYDLKALYNTFISMGISTDFQDTAETILRFDVLAFLTTQNKNCFNGLNYLPMDSHCLHTNRHTLEQETYPSIHTLNCIEGFVLEKGVAVIWGLNGEYYDDNIRQIAKYLNQFSDIVLRPAWHSHTTMLYCLISQLPKDYPVPRSRVKNERLYLKTGSCTERLAASLALGQSSRLQVYEEAVEDAIRKFGMLPLRIAANEFYEYFNYGKSEVLNIRKWVAEIYTVVLDVNIVEDFLDVPEYFWKCDDYERFWRQVHLFFEIEARIRILNIRVGCIQEVLKVVSHQRVKAQGIHLAWCVIILLTINVVVLVVKAILDRYRQEH